MRRKWRKFTKQDVFILLKFWETASLREIADLMNRSIGGVINLSRRIKESGYKLPPKPRVFRDRNWLIKEALREKGLIR